MKCQICAISRWTSVQVKILHRDGHRPTDKQTDMYAISELSMCPFCVTRSTQPITSGKIWTQPNTAIKFDCLMQLNLI